MPQAQFFPGSPLAELGFSLRALREGYGSGLFSVPEVIDEACRRIEACEGPIFLHRADANALRAEAEKQQHWLRSHPGAHERWPLLGIPFAVKDNIDVAGMPTTAGCPALSRIPNQSAPAVEALLRAGAICLGKTHMDQLATGLVGVRNPAGPCRNAFDPEYVAGGSSSGSGLAVSLGLVAFALGTDTAGSGRVPAAFGHIVGYKPSRGTVSSRGVVPACPSLDCVSVFTLFAEDAETVLEHLGGYDPLDPWSRRLPSPGSTPAQLPNASQAPAKEAPASWRGLRLGIAHPGQLDFEGDEGYTALYHRALEASQQLGARCLGQDIGPLYEAARLLYQGPWIAERYAAISESIDPESDQVLPVIRDVLRPGRHLPATEVFRGQRRLQALRRAAELLFENCDALLLPTVPTAFTLAQVAADPIGKNSVLGRFTNFVNLLDLAAVAVPAGFRPDGMPFGVTLMAPAFHDRRLLALADGWQRHFDHGAGRGLWRLPPRQPNPQRPGPQTPPAASAATVPLVVFGLHLRGQALASDVEARGGRYAGPVHTATGYAMYALRRGERLFPGVVREPAAAGKLLGDLWHLPAESLGAFMQTLAAPLSLGFIELADGTRAIGFLAEAAACVSAEDITRHGGWLAWKQASAHA